MVRPPPTSSTTVEQVSKSQPIGIGAVLGAPSGITAEFWRANHQSIDAGVAFGYFGYSMLYGDYLFHYPYAFKSSEFSPYFGPGLFVANSYYGYLYNSAYSVFIGLRLNAGVQWFPKGVPVGIFAEVGPGLALVPFGFPLMSGGVGARYFF